MRIKFFVRNFDKVQIFYSQIDQAIVFKVEIENFFRLKSIIQQALYLLVHQIGFPGSSESHEDIVQLMR